MCKPGRGTGLVWNVVLPLQREPLWEIRNAVGFTSPPYVLAHSPPTLFISSSDYLLGVWGIEGGGWGSRCTA